MTVLLNSGNNKVDLSLVQELETESLGSLLGKVDNDKVRAESKDAGQYSFEDEDPAPALDVLSVICGAIDRQKGDLLQCREHEGKEQLGSPS